jgi:hypothetical protein
MVELDCNFITQVMKFQGYPCYEKKEFCYGVSGVPRRYLEEPTLSFNLSC